MTKYLFPESSVEQQGPYRIIMTRLMGGVDWLARRSAQNREQVEAIAELYQLLIAIATESEKSITAEELLQAMEFQRDAVFLNYPELLPYMDRIWELGEQAKARAIPVTEYAEALLTCNQSPEEPMAIDVRDLPCAWVESLAQIFKDIYGIVETPEADSRTIEEKLGESDDTSPGLTSP